jgi:hypothetical protein
MLGKKHGLRTRFHVAALSGLALMATGSSSRGAFTFDPDGALPGNAFSSYGAMDWSVGNALGQNMVTTPVGGTFQHFYQARLSSLVDVNGNPTVTNGLNNSFEITAIASVTETVNAVGGGNLSFALSAVQSPNSFLEIWFDSTPDANPLAGTGYNDGTRILLGGPNPSQPNNGIVNSIIGVSQPLDQFGTNNYPGKTTALSAGGLDYKGNVTTTDGLFFILGLLDFSFNTSLTTPFLETNPSALFAGAAGGGAPGVVPNNNVNGTQSPDYQHQADGNMTFTDNPGGIPEPGAATLAAAGGSLAMGLRRRRSHRG